MTRGKLMAIKEVLLFLFKINDVRLLPRICLSEWQ